MLKKLQTNSVILLLFALLFLSNCDMNFEEDIEEETHTTYTFFASRENTSLSAERLYEIGTSLTSSTLPDLMQDGVNAFKKGYYISGWSYWKNPDTQNEEKPDWITADEAGTVEHITIHPERAYFFVSNFLPITYYLRFNANGGSGVMENQVFTYDVSARLSKNLFTRNGYDFKGWGRNASDISVSYSDEAEIENLTAQKNALIDLYAIWWKTEITLSFDANGASGSMSAVKVKIGDTIPLNTFVKEGYTFSHWSSSADGFGSVYYSDGEELTEANWCNDDTTLFAQWSINTYTLTICDTDGSYLYSQPCNWNEETAISYTPTKTGYTFLGYSSTSGGSVEYSESITLTADKTLYAVWQEQTMTVNYDANGGSGTMASESVKFSHLPLTIKENVFTKEGYTFTYWLGTDGKTYNANDSISSSNWVSGTLTLFAQWQARGQVNETTNSAGVSVSSTSTGLTFTAYSGYSVYVWFINSEKQSSSTNTLSISYSDYPTGEHTIICYCISGQTTAEYVATFTVN